MRTLYFYHELEDMYQDMIDDCHEVIDVCGMKYNAGAVLLAVDPIAFRCGVSDWSSEEYEELSYSDLTEEEREHYIASERTTMYCHKDEVDDVEEAA